MDLIYCLLKREYRLNFRCIHLWFAYFIKHLQWSCLLFSEQHDAVINFVRGHTKYMYIYLVMIIQRQDMVHYNKLKIEAVVLK